MAEKVTTKEAIKKLNEQLECSLCLDIFKQPKLLPCFHVFCKSPCLEKLVAKDGHSLTCPTCRHIVPLSEKGVAGLQSDFYTDRLFEVRDVISKVSESSDTQCGSCEAGKATGYCQDCEGFVCNECQAAHDRFKVMNNHQIISLAELQAQTLNFLLPKKAVPHCPKHPENTLKIYCETCSVLICNDCTICLHRDHNYELMADVQAKHKEKLVSSLKPVREKLDEVQQALKDFDTRAKEINDQRATLEADIHKRIDQQHQLLDQRRVELVGELEMLTQQKLTSLAAQRDKVEITQAKLASCLEYAEGGLKAGTDDEVLAMKAPVLKRIEQISTEFDPNTLQPETQADVKVVSRQKKELQQYCSRFIAIKHGGTFSLANSHIMGDGLKEATTGEQNCVVFQAITKAGKKYSGSLNLKAKLLRTKSKNRPKCDIVVEQNGRYMIRYQPVNRGKHELHLTINGHPVRGSPFPITVDWSLSPHSKPIRVIQGLSYPRGTAVNSKGEIILVEDGASVSVLTPEGVKTQTFGSEGSGNGELSNAYGVTVDREDNIYVADYSNHRIQKFNSEGEFVAAVGSMGSGQLQFSFPLSICYNNRDNNLYVGDQWNHRIQVLTTDLKFVRCFGKQNENGELQYPWYIAFDNANNLYVADKSNNCVVVFTAEGQFLRAFSQKSNGQNLISPIAITIDMSNTVYVSEDGPHCVSVFTSQGDYITTFGSKGSNEGQFNEIYGLSVDINNFIIVSDYHNGQLQIFQSLKEYSAHTNHTHT